MKGISDGRPDPDQLLALLKKEEEKSNKGKLKIFFGMCAGVGKTYAMLQAARLEKQNGKNIIIGYVETHNRKETDKLAEGFQVIPRKVYEYRSAKLRELDLDAVIQRKPQVVLVDELAHSNAPGCRHLKRYQDVKELLDNGIDVYTTVNVQHIESRSETVSQITGITVRETIPDEVFENADEVELVDLSPDELLQRFSEGKVYSPEKSEEAVKNFFRKGNITALREMALRIVADRVDKQLHDYLKLKLIKGPWKSGLHLLVVIDYRKQTENLLRWAKNLSYSMGAVIRAIYVETSHVLNLQENEQLEKNIQVAGQLGIEVRIVTNYDSVNAIIDFSEKENITHIVVGKPPVTNQITAFRQKRFINRLLQYSGSFDVFILGSDIHNKEIRKSVINSPAFTSTFKQYLATFLLISFVSIISFFLKKIIGYQVVSFILLLVVSALAFFYGTGPVLLASTLSALVWDFFFLPPPYTLHIEKPEDVFMLVMFFIIALLNGVLTTRIRRQEKKIRVREERTHALYQVTRELSIAPGMSEVLEIAVKRIRDYFKMESRILLKNDENQLVDDARQNKSIVLSENDLSIANWTFQQLSKAGKNTSTLPASDFTFYPLKGSQLNPGVIVVRHTKVFTQGEEQFWDAFIAQVSGKLEREYLRNMARHALVLSESDKLYKTLFNSISHELRIPVATIMGASDLLLAQAYPDEIRNNLYGEINTASIRLNRLIENLLNMSRLESGRITPRPDWCDINDLVNKVAESLKQELKPFKFIAVIPNDLPLIRLDFGLIEHVLHNLLLNASQNAPPGTTIRLKFFFEAGLLTIQVMDRGSGFPSAELRAVFDKFYRGKGSKPGGTGLGLSIVKGFVEAHGGMVVAANRSNGGAIFTISLPVEISDLSDLINKE